MKDESHVDEKIAEKPKQKKEKPCFVPSGILAQF